eukprot:scaffold122533_cov77-Cyclotella_meneghiniana.AAC.2
MDSNLNLAQAFIILTMIHWNGCDAVKCLNQPKSLNLGVKVEYMNAEQKPTFTPTPKQNT